MTAMDVENTDRANSGPLRRSRMCVISPYADRSQTRPVDPDDSSRPTA